MSSIAFHSPTRTVRVAGAERARMQQQCARFALAFLDTSDWSPLGALLPPALAARCARAGPGREQTLRLWFMAGEDAFQVAPETRVDVFALQLNTVVAVGDDSMRLAARLHGQCEGHCYVEGPHRAWLAGLVERALARGVFRDRFSYRDPFGWAAVAAFLREREDEPVVTSYSVTEEFPDPALAGATWEEWEGLADDRRWARSLAGLRAEPGRWHELTPARWDTYHFEHGWTALDLMAWADRARGLPSSPTRAPQPTWMEDGPGRTPPPTWVGIGGDDGG